MNYKHDLGKSFALFCWSKNYILPTWYEPGQCSNAGHFDLCTYISNSCNQSKDFANSILVTRNDYWLQLIEIYYIFYLCVCICAKKDALKHWAIILDLKSLITVVCSQSKLQGNIYVYVYTYLLHICPKTQNRQTKKQKVRCQPFRFASL